MSERKSTNTLGVRYREHASRKHGKQKDKYFYIRYKKNKKDNEEGLGWASQGWTEQKAGVILFEIKENIKFGRSPQSFKEMRTMEEKSETLNTNTDLRSDKNDITLQETFDRYLEVHKIETSGRTWVNSQKMYQKWIEKPLGSLKLNEVTADKIQTVISKAFQTLSPKTVMHIRNLLRQIFNYAKKYDLYFKDNPAVKVKVKQRDNRRCRFLTKEEARILLTELKTRSIDIHDMALLSLYSGMRAGEIFNLQWERVLWHVERISIADPKNGEGRMEPMHPLVKEMLQRRYTDSQRGYVFKSRTGGRVKEVSDTFQRTVDRLGFNDNIADSRQKVVFHTLRHTYASWLVMSGVDLYTTQKLMGHKSNQMTQRYAHLAPGYLEKAVNSLESI